MLGAMAGEADRVRFLKGVSADQVRRNLTGKNDHGDAVHQRIRDAGYGIGRARTGCDAHDTRLPGRTGIALCRMSGRLLMARSEEHTSELQSLMRTSYAVFCLKNKTALEPNK